MSTCVVCSIHDGYQIVVSNEFGTLQAHVRWRVIFCLPTAVLRTNCTSTSVKVEFIRDTRGWTWPIAYGQFTTFGSGRETSYPKQGIPPPASGEEATSGETARADDFVTSVALVAGIETHARLSPNPRNLHTLWQEYEFGFGGRKPAKDFMAEERGRVKYSYHRRKVV
jgi:hypothetical protein